MINEDDLIKVEDGRITIRHGFDEQGEQIFNVITTGDMTYLTALGLLTVAKDQIDMHYMEGEDD